MNDQLQEILQKISDFFMQIKATLEKPLFTIADFGVALWMVIVAGLALLILIIIFAKCGKNKIIKRRAKKAKRHAVAMARAQLKTAKRNVKATKKLKFASKEEKAEAVKDAKAAAKDAKAEFKRVKKTKVKSYIDPRTRKARAAKKVKKADIKATKAEIKSAKKSKDKAALTTAKSKLKMIKKRTIVFYMFQEAKNDAVVDYADNGEMNDIDTTLDKTVAEVNGVEYVAPQEEAPVEEAVAEETPEIVLDETSEAVLEDTTAAPQEDTLSDVSSEEIAPEFAEDELELTDEAAEEVVPEEITLDDDSLEATEEVPTEITDIDDNLDMDTTEIPQDITIDDDNIEVAQDEVPEEITVSDDNLATDEVEDIVIDNDVLDSDNVVDDTIAAARVVAAASVVPEEEPVQDEVAPVEESAQDEQPAQDEAVVVPVVPVVPAPKKKKVSPRKQAPVKISKPPVPEKKKRKAPIKPPTAVKVPPKKVATPKPVISDNTMVISGDAKDTFGKYYIVENVRNSHRPYRFVLKANNGQILFESEPYKIKPKLASILAFKKHCANGTFEVDEDKTGAFRYKLYSKTDMLIGVGASYPTRVACENSIESVKKFAESATVVEDITEA